MKHLIFGAIALAVSSVAMATTPSIDIKNARLLGDKIIAGVDATLPKTTLGNSKCRLTLSVSDGTRHQYSDTKNIDCDAQQTITADFDIPNIDRGKFPNDSITLIATAFEYRVVNVGHGGKQSQIIRANRIATDDHGIDRNETIAIPTLAPTPSVASAPGAGGVTVPQAQASVGTATAMGGSIDEGGAGINVEPAIKFACSEGCDNKATLIRGKGSHKLRLVAIFAKDSNQPAPTEADIEISGIEDVDFSEISKQVHPDPNDNSMVRAINLLIEIAPSFSMAGGTHTLTATAKGKTSTPKESITFDFDVEVVDVPFVCISGVGDNCVVHFAAASSVDVSNGMIFPGERYHHAVVDARIIPGGTTTVKMVCRSEFDAGCNAPVPIDSALAPYLKFGIECKYNHLTEEKSLARGASTVHSFEADALHTHQKCIARSDAPFFLQTITMRNPTASD